MNADGRKFISESIRELIPDITEHQMKRIFTKVDRTIDRLTYQAMEAVIHNLNTMQSRAGSQVPFSSLNFGTDITEEGRLVIKNFLLATKAGLGHGETAIFPVSVFKVKEGVNYNPSDPNYDLFRLACEVSAKRLFPNFVFIDAPFNIQYYKPGVVESEIATMGCVEKNEVITYKINDTVYVESFARAFNRILSIGHIIKYSDKTDYVDVTNEDVSIYDTNANAFVKVKKFIKNKDVTGWSRVSLNNGRSLVATNDHPLPVEGKGRTYVSDLCVGDMIPVTYKGYESTNDTDTSISEESAWLLGLLLCDSSYASSIVISVGLDEVDIIEGIKNSVSSLSPDCYTYVKEQIRGAKGNYYDVSIRCPSLKPIVNYLTDIFGGVKKNDRQIPTAIFRSSREVRLKFLAGMLDADGYIAHFRDGREHDTCRGNLGSINKELALQQMYLIQSLGLPCKMYIKHYKSGDFTKLRYKLEFPLSSELVDCMYSGKKKAVFDAYKSCELKLPESATVTSIECLDVVMDSYDVETVSDRFDVSGILSHNCRTRVIGNVYDPDRQIVAGRGNLSFTSINLPRLGIEAHGDIDKFFELLDNRLTLVIKQLLDRFNVQCQKHVYNYPMLMEQGVWIDSEKLKPEDSVREVLKHGTLAIGFIGLAECLVALTGKHHGESEESQELGLRIVKFMRDRTDKESEKRKLNFGIIGTPKICGHLCRNV